jgi:hypothetical protein
MGIDQARDPARRAGYDNATEEAFSLARDAQAAAKRNEPDARFMSMQAQMLLFTDSVMREGQGQASLQPLLAIARAVARPGPQVPPLLLRGSRRPADGRGALPDDCEHGQPVERLDLRVRRAGAPRPLAVGRDEAGARPGPRDRLLRSDQRGHARRGRADDGDRALGDGAGRAPPQPAGRPPGPRREHGRLPRGGDERPPPRAGARDDRPARLPRGRLRPAQPEGRRPLARDLGQGLPPRRHSSSAPGGTSGSTRGPSATWWPTSRTDSGGPTPKGGPGLLARTLRSDLVFIRLRGPLPWGTFRDVYEVDGQAVRDRDRRLERLLSATRAPEVGRAWAILDEARATTSGPTAT